MENNDDISVNLAVVRKVGYAPAIIYGILCKISETEADEKGWIKITQKQLSDMCGMSVPTISKNLPLLQQHGLLKIYTENTREGNYYRVLKPKF